MITRMESIAHRIEVVERMLERLFRQALDNCGSGDPPQLKEVRLDYVITHDCIRITVILDQGGRERMMRGEVSAREAARSLPQRRTVLYEAGALWSKCYEDHYINRVLRAQQQRVIETAQSGDVSSAMAMHESLRGLEAYTRQHHFVPSSSRAARIREQDDRITYGARWYEDRVEIVPQSDTVTQRANQIAQDMARRIDEQIASAFLSDASNLSTTTETSTATEVRERILEAARALAANPFHRDWRDAFEVSVDPASGPDRTIVRAEMNYGYRVLRQQLMGDFAFHGTQIDAVWIDEIGSFDVGPKEAQEKAIVLLKEHLTPEQRKSYEEKRYFDVKGGESGRTYRIRHGRQMNIEALDAKGNREFGVCFLPVGNLPAGDIMISQKTALELYESEALAIANRF